MFQALASKKINILVISTSEIKISVLIATNQVKKAIAVLHKEFKLEKLDGMNFNIIKDEWSVSSDTSINYIVKSVKL
ncbi:ACT domain-containing protein, partial [bacterium]|nr:ACT domain-containing protein [bacterium]